jgi:hypothetical protein
MNVVAVHIYLCRLWSVLIEFGLLFDLTIQSKKRDFCTPCFSRDEWWSDSNLIADPTPGTHPCTSCHPLLEQRANETPRHHAAACGKPSFTTDFEPSNHDLNEPRLLRAVHGRKLHRLAGLHSHTTTAHHLDTFSASFPSYLPIE